MYKYITAAFALLGTAQAASLQSVTGWGTNPSNIQMYIYVPDRVAANPPIIVMLHGCGGSAQQMFGQSQMPSYANQYGFVLIYPQTPNQSNCWDNHSAKSLTRNSGGDTQGIVQQVQYALQKYNGDASRVYAVGFSSGAMMTNNLVATYPDIFEAGASNAGVPACCFAGASGSTPSTANQTCAGGNVIKTAPEWGNFARNTYPGGYTGRRPRMQIWHGASDTLVKPVLLQEQLKQWSNVLGLSLTGTNSNTPQSGYTQSVYGDGTQLVGYSIAGAGHGFTINDVAILKFFGIPGSSPTSSSATLSTTTANTATTRSGGTTRTITTRSTIATTSTWISTTSATTRTTTAANGSQQTRWGQCGGVGWTGATACSATYTCSTLNPYYAQCL